MSSSLLPNIPSLRRQQLVLDFNILNAHCPEGIYLSLTPRNPSLWPGVLFIRSGPYASAVLRFQISFPEIYPELPPLITVSTDIFHPLVVPLTTYTSSTGVLDSTDTVGDTYNKRLPSGAFSLRDGFPHWYGQTVQSCDASRKGSDDIVVAATSSTENRQGLADPFVLNISTSPRKSSPPDVSIVKVLEYMKSTFEDAGLLDSLSLENAGNPSAWHAWRAHRGLPKVVSSIGSPVKKQSQDTPTTSKHPGEWNWDGVWEARVKSGVEYSSSDPVLFGSSNNRGGQSSTETIRFSKMNDERMTEIRSLILGVNGDEEREK